jgi:hypothetical protein
LTRRDNQNFRLRAPFFAAIITTARHQILMKIVALFSSKLSRCYFGDITIDRVTEAKLADYVDRRLSQPRQPAVATLKNERNAIRQLPRFAKRKGYVSDVPAFSIKSGKTNARPNIPEVEWHTCHSPIAKSSSAWPVTSKPKLARTLSKRSG